MPSKSSKSRLLLVVGGALVIALAGFGIFNRQSSASDAVIVYKTPTCGCCGGWIEHLEANGFEVEVNDLDNLTGIKNVHHVPTGMRTCHTGLVGGYVVEGHVPAEFVQRLLDEKPDIEGIGVPGMPIGSPGIEGSYRESYDVLAFNSQGRTAVWGHVEGDPGR